MSKGYIKTKVLTYIDVMESDIEFSRPSCMFIRESSYAKFLIENKILKSHKNSIVTLFLYTTKRPSACANLFRMMVIVEYCKQQGIEL
jgi:hypothetical protein